MCEFSLFSQYFLNIEERLKYTYSNYTIQIVMEPTHSGIHQIRGLLFKESKYAKEDFEKMKSFRILRKFRIIKRQKINI